MKDAWATGAVAFLSAALVLMVTPRVTDLAVLWPANALILAAALLGTPERVTARVALGLIGTFFANAVTGATWVISFGYAVANGVEVVVALLLIRHLGLQGRPFGRFDTVATFAVVAGGVAPAAGALLGATWSWLFAAEPFVQVLTIWYRSCALGAFLVTPMAIILWLSRAQMRPRSAAQNILKLASLLMVAAITAVSFLLPLPLLFIPFAAMVIKTVRAGWLGAVRSTLIVAIVGGALTLGGYGPIARFTTPEMRLLFLQFYIAACFLTVLTVASLLDERGRLTRELLQVEARYRLLSEHSADALLHIDPAGTCLYASPASAELIGLTPAELEGSILARFVHPEDRAQIAQTHLEVLTTPNTSSVCRFRALHRGGRGERWLETRTRGIHDASGIASGAVSVIRDVTNDVVREANLSVAAETDPLTGLANRRRFLAALDHHRQHQSEKGFAVAMLDLDHFKSVNDRYGHAMGDTVLKAVARTSLDAVRSIDVVARLGGEEFALLLPGADERIAREVGERLRVAIERLEVCAGDDEPVRVTVSVGLALGRTDIDAAGLLALADLQLYAAKAAGRNRLRLAA
ncbi:MAG: diguanylate cyclase [Sphingomonadales bacterium]